MDIDQLPLVRGATTLPRLFIPQVYTCGTLKQHTPAP